MTAPKDEISERECIAWAEDVEKPRGRRIDGCK